MTAKQQIRAAGARGFVFITDNGATYCYEHLGDSARETGRDISGQPIVPQSKAQQATDPYSFCETCHPRGTYHTELAEAYSDANCGITPPASWTCADLERELCAITERDWPTESNG